MKQEWNKLVTKMMEDKMVKIAGDKSPTGHRNSDRIWNYHRKANSRHPH